MDESIAKFQRRWHAVELALKLGDGHGTRGLGFLNGFGR